MKALSHELSHKFPIWLMRQAGRALPEYRAYRSGRKLWDLFHDTPSIVDITQMPVNILKVDAAILFSDILTVLDGLGVDYTFDEKQGPILNYQGFNPNPDAYEPIIEAIKILKKQLTVPLIGFCGAPFTLASYLIEGKTTKQFLKAKRCLYEDPSLFKKILAAVVEETARYLTLQIKAGCDALQIFDSWAHHLNPGSFDEWVVDPLRELICLLPKKRPPILLFSKASSLHLERLCMLPVEGFSVDWGIDLQKARQIVGPGRLLQGNLDPSLLFLPKKELSIKLDNLLTPRKKDPSYIFNLGHGLIPETPIASLKFMVEYVNHFSRSDS
jgi:uroporphyrinogen decarboxylase